ncbi:MAG TPA: VOC family protein [Thermoanaerobaculia bacterium]|nr:VOC family protein [Thermoanaerobaculia bacterium]
MHPKLEGFAPLLQVFDMPTSLAFYRDLLGFELAGTSDPGASDPGRAADDVDWALLRRDGIELMLNTAYEHGERPAEPVADRTTVHGDTGLFFGCRDLDAAYEHFRANGIRLDPPSVAPYGMRQLWLRDPDGYVVCLQWPAG